MADVTWKAGDKFNYKSDSVGGHGIVLESDGSKALMVIPNLESPERALNIHRGSIPTESRPFANNIPYDQEIILDAGYVAYSGKSCTVPQKYGLSIQRK